MMACITATSLLGLASLTPQAMAQATGNTYSGQATVINITDIHQPFPGPIVICDTGPLPSTGGFLEASVLETNVANGELTLELAHATTSGDGAAATSQTSVNNFTVMIMAADGTESSLRADFIGSQAMASCEPNGKVDLSGSVDIQGLVVNGQAIVVTKRANQVIIIPGGKIIVNEQTSSTSGNTGSITVTAIHILMDGCMNGAIGTVHSDITCNGVPPSGGGGECGKLTGGGWIVTPSGYKGTFGVSGGIRRGAFWGHVNYIDHSTGMHVKSTSVTGFTVDPNDAKCRFITYNVLIDGTAGTATVHA